VSLPGGADGIEGARRILEILPVHIIIITGYEDETLRRRAEGINPAGFFVKPLSVPQVSQIARVIESLREPGEN
jgi:DNA-binding NarL/FixJ family response regulator